MAEFSDAPPIVFDAPAEWTFPALGSRTVPPGARVDVDAQDATWTVYDTAAGDLQRYGALLTRAADGTWRLRVDGRLLTASGTGRTVPPELREPVLGITCGAALRRTPGIEGTWTTRVVVDADGAVLGEIDELVQRRADGSVQRRIEVIPVEKSFGAAVVKRLAKAGATRRADPPAPADPTVADAVQIFLHDRYCDILRGDVHLRRAAATAMTNTAAGTATGTAAIHPTRVAIRRLRSILRVVDVFDAEQATALDRELSWVSGVLGAVRDTDVLREHLADARHDLPEGVPGEALGAAVDAALDARAAAARDALAGAMRGRRYLALLRELRNWTDTAPLTPAARKPAKRLRHYARQAQRTMRKRLDEATTAAQMHRARKAAKRARYVAEFADETVGGSHDVRTEADRAKKLQTKLGDRQDAAVAADFLLHLGAKLTGEAAFACGVLWAAEQQRARS